MIIVLVFGRKLIFPIVDALLNLIDKYISILKWYF
jgi:hypothetical protein